MRQEKGETLEPDNLRNEIKTRVLNDTRPPENQTKGTQ